MYYLSAVSIHIVAIVCAKYLSRFIEEGQKCKKYLDLSKIVNKSKCIELLGLWNCREFKIDCISQFHIVLEGCKEFTKSKTKLVEFHPLVLYIKIQ